MRSSSATRNKFEREREKEPAATFTVALPVSRPIEGVSFTYLFCSLIVTLALTLTAVAEPNSEAILRFAIERVQSVEVATGRIEDRSLSQRQGEEDRKLSLDATMMLKRMTDGSELGWAIAYEAKASAFV